MQFKYLDTVFTDHPESMVPTPNGLVKLCDSLGMSTEELQTAIAEYNLNIVRNKRANEYPSIGDQLDALYHAGLFPDDMAAKILEIKTKYPKE